MISSSKNHFPKPLQTPQAGVTLMLAVLVLSAITAVAFSLATIVFIEIRSAGDSARTEPALYATLGVTEEALFQYKRYNDPINDGSGDDGSTFDVPSCHPAFRQICNINGVTLTMPGIQPIAFDDSPRVEFVGAGVTKVIPMYVVNDFDQQYDSLQIDVLPNETSGSVEVSFEVTQANETSPTIITGGSVSPGRPYTYTGFSLTGQYDLVITNTNNKTHQDVSVVITTERVGGAQPEGLPFVGEQVLRIMADYVGLTRTYQVRIPVP